MSLYRRGETWWIYLVHGGRRIRCSAGTSDKEAAQRLHDELKAELWRHRRGAHTWTDAVKAWLLEAPRDDADKYRLRALTLPDLPLPEITADAIEAALAGKSPGSWNRTCNLILAILNGARRRGWIDVTPTVRRRKTPPGRVEWLTAEQWEALRGALTGNLRQLARFALATGVRRHNATHLEWSQVDLRRRVAWIHPDQAKARKPLGIPLSDEAVRVLREQEGLHERWVFPYRGQPQHAVATKAWRDACEAAGVPGFTFHGLRHTWASWHVMNGTRLEELQRLGGWATMQMVTRYAHLAPEHLARLAGNARPVSLKRRSRPRTTPQRRKKAA